MRCNRVTGIIVIGISVKGKGITMTINRVTDNKVMIKTVKGGTLWEKYGYNQ